jgi:hypothetical protein
VNGWLTWALGELDGTVPDARTLAWSEYTRNTLANHSAEFPDHWAGTISIDDTCYAYYATHPERCGNDLYRTYDGQITEQATWMVMDAIRLAGITPTGAGFRIAPRLPFRRFSLRLPRIGVVARPHRLRGYVRPEQDGPVELRVTLPRSADPAAAATSAGGRPVAHDRTRDAVVFRVPGHAGAPATWTVSW